VIPTPPSTEVVSPFRILDRKRRGEALSAADLRAVVAGAADGSWSDAQLAAFLMAAAVRGLDAAETHALTLAMLESGERWDLAADLPALADKHSTGGVADTVSLVLAPILAACGVEVVMLTGRGLGHTGGTADKLESIPGLSLDLDRGRCLALLRRHRMAIGVATRSIAPADRRLYALRDQTATISSLPLITGSILSKKLATGAAALVFDVKTGNGAFLAERAEAEALARLLVATTVALGRRASALLTDMSQPLGAWAGHTAEVRATFDALEGRGGVGAGALMAVTYALGEEIGRLTGHPLRREDLEAAVASGRAREAFSRWAADQGADPAWLARPSFPLAPVETVIEAPRAGRLAAVDARQLGLLLAEAGGARRSLGGPIDLEVAVHVEARLGDEVEKGRELARLYLRRDDSALVARFGACFTVADEARPPQLVLDRIDG
jgi:pyrimidine-nucleoside phosphorylase